MRAELASQPYFTDAEAEAFVKDTLARNDRDRRDGGPATDAARGVADFWFDRGTGVAVMNGRKLTSLVVDTTNFTGETAFRGSSDQLHLTERFTRVDASTLQYEYTVDDPATFTRPWTATLPMTKSDERIYEYACQEGNYALPDILRGARYEE